jgi:TaqI-like C-terminal specificity domain/Eco57I restriction-modification methylase
LRSIYKYDVDGALVVFAQGDKWRLSFISEIRVLDAEGKISTKATEPRRYTYLLGKGEKTKTPSTRLATLVGKPIVLEDIRTAFGVEALNEEFYKAIAEYFYQLVGATSTKGKQKVIHERVLKLPSLGDDDLTPYKEFAVRLIGRTVFCWFLKVKKSDAGKALLPEQLLSSEAVRANFGYYHAILERLFFQTLNTPVAKRVLNLPAGCEEVPFLNGGLFEPHAEDFYELHGGLSKYLNTLVIPDAWFLGLFEMLEQFNFTIDENSTLDIEVSVDPEMLGRIFENLLAEIDPDSGETARKATGSFYTPREIVDYMATESLVYHLQRKSGLSLEEIRPVFKIDTALTLDTAQKTKLLEGLADLKVLDPACGSGAFPMGVLQKIVQALQKLDPKAAWWKVKQLEGIGNALIRKEVQKKLDAASWEYVRKLGIIQNSLYGVDIQPIAAEISKLRCFLTLIVDETIDDTAPNRGIEPLPNLEFKFVTADGLLKLPKEGFGTLFNVNDELEHLKELRLDYLQSFGEDKKAIKEKYKAVQKSIFGKLAGGIMDPKSRAYKLSSWDPFGHARVDWFDPLWMFGVEDFDVVIGNPPYLSHDRIKQIDFLKANYKCFEPYADLYCYFIERGVELLTSKGTLSYITSNSYLRADYGKPLRELLIDDGSVHGIVNIEDSQLFGNAIVNNAILSYAKEVYALSAKVVSATMSPNQSFSDFVDSRSYQYEQADFPRNRKWALLAPREMNLMKRIEHGNKTLEQLKVKIRLGLATGQNDAFIIPVKKANDLIERDPRSRELIKPVLRGRDIHRFHYQLPELRILLTKNGVNVAEYPAIYGHLDSFGEAFKKRGAKGQHWTNLRACAFFDDFAREKIVWIELSDTGRFALCNEEVYLLNSAYFMIPPVGISSEYLLGILNSKVIHFYLHNIAESSGMGTARWFNKDVKEFPIAVAIDQKPIAMVSSYLTLARTQFSKILVDEFVRDEWVVVFLEELNDALVLELYFPTEFRDANISFASYVSRDFKPIEGMKGADAFNYILELVSSIKSRNNEIRQNLKLMDTRLSDVILPIKNVR